LLPTRSNRRKSVLFEGKDIRLLGQPRRYRRYASTPNVTLYVHCL